jgi:hypothetical protein
LRSATTCGLASIICKADLEVRHDVWTGVDHL